MRERESAAMRDRASAAMRELSYERSMLFENDAMRELGYTVREQSSERVMLCERCAERSCMPAGKDLGYAATKAH